MTTATSDEQQSTMVPQNAERVAEMKSKLTQLATANTPHKLTVVWRMKAQDELEEPGDTLEWQGTASINGGTIGANDVEISFIQHPGNLYSFPRADVEYLRLSVKRTTKEMPAKRVGPTVTKDQ